MYFEELRARNFGPFRDLTVTLPLGSVGIFGSNGVGKSTLINLPYALLTGEFNRYDGLKIDNINNLADDSEDSFISGALVHNGARARLCRRLRGRPLQELVVEGEKPITAAKGIQERLEALLAVPMEVLDLYAFKAQDRIYDFLVAEPAARARAYQALFGTQACESAWDLLGTVLNRDTDLHAELVDNSDELTALVREAAKRIQEIEAEKSVHVAKQLNEVSLASALAILDKARRRQIISDDLVRVSKNLEVARADLTTALEASEVKAQRLDVLRAESASQCASAQQAKQALRDFAAYAKRLARRTELMARQKGLREEAKARPEPPAPVGDLDALAAQVTTLERELEDAKRSLALLDAEGVVACPTCGTRVAELRDHVAGLRKIVRTQPARIEKAQAAKQDYLRGQRAATAWHGWHAGWAAECKSIEAELAALEDLQEPAGDARQLRDLALAYEQLEMDCEQARLRYDRSLRDVDQSQARLRALEEEHARLQNLLAEVEVKANLADKAEQRLAEHNAAKNAVASLEGELKGWRRSQQDRTEELERLRARLAQRRKLRAMAKILEKVRGVLHRDALPRAVAHTNLRRIAAEINEAGLSLFGNPFWVETRDDLTFAIHKPGEPPHGQGRLSTGQKVVLALAFWLAIGSLWRNEIGMLALDEPTANLDETNRRFLGSALSQLSLRVRGNRQILLVTHDQQLRGAFDHVVDLDALAR